MKVFSSHTRLKLIHKALEIDDHFDLRAALKELLDAKTQEEGEQVLENFLEEED